MGFDKFGNKPKQGKYSMFKWLLTSASALTLSLSVLLSPLSANAGEGKEHIVRVVSDYKNLRFYFSPKQLRIEPGDTVVWVNEAEETHNMLSFPDGHGEIRTWTGDRAEKTGPRRALDL